jgi:nucleoid-associated protein YgaU
MPKIRHTNRLTFRNTEELYREYFRDRKVSSIRQHATVEMRHPTAKQDKLLTKMEHTWQAGDKLWKIAQQHYGDPSYWWVIAWYNLKPTDSHFRLGDRVLIPKPLGKILKFYGY